VATSSPAAARDWRGSAIVLVAATLFGTLGVLSRQAYAEGLTPFAWVAWRALIGTVGLTVLLGVRGGQGAAIGALVRSGRQVKSSLALAVGAGALLNLAIFVAFDRTTIALALLGFYTYPAMVAAGSAILGRERLDGRGLAALALALLGMVAVVLGGLDPGASLTVDALGLGLALVAALCQSVFVLASRGYRALPAAEAMRAILAGTTVIAILVTIGFDGTGALGRPLSDPGLLVLMLGVGLFAAALPSFLFLTGIRRLGGVPSGILMLFEPVVGVVLAAAFLAERITPVQALGGATILAAAVLLQRRAAADRADPAVAAAPGGP
jgi:drug/metabolite transporter (DMT)-like permease